MEIDTSKVIGLEGGKDGTWFKVLAEEGRGKTKYYPAIVEGIEVGRSSFRSPDDFAAHQTEIERETIRFKVTGNAVAAEMAIQQLLGCRALAISGTTVDVYPDQSMGDAPSAAAFLGSITSNQKVMAARENGKRGGRPATNIVVQLTFNRDGSKAFVYYDDDTIQTLHADETGFIDLSKLWFIDSVTGRKVRWGEEGLQQVNGGWARI